jgi:hypothetical protein
MTPGLRRLYMPRPVRVEADSGGRPGAVHGIAVEAIREEWLVEDRWWTLKPMRRHYFELVLADGRDVVVFRSATSGRWYKQRA